MVAWGAVLHRCCFLTNFRLLALRISKIPLSNASKPHFLGEASGSGSWNCSVHVCWCYWHAIWWVRSAVKLLGQDDFGFASVCWCYCVSQSSCCCIQTAASRLCEMDVKRQKRCQENYIMREMSRDRDVDLKEMSREREREREGNKFTRKGDVKRMRSINTEMSWDVKRKRCLQTKTQEKESLRDEMPREKDAKSREKCEQQAMPQEIWKKTAAVPARWLVEFVSQCSHPAQICSVWRSRWIMFQFMGT